MNVFKYIFVVAVLVGVAGTSLAADYNWASATNGYWSTNTNWNPGGVPGTGDRAWFETNNTAATRYTVTVDGTYTVAGLHMGGASAANLDSYMTLDLNNYTLTVDVGDNGSFFVTAAYDGSTADVIVKDSSVGGGGNIITDNFKMGSESGAQNNVATCTFQDATQLNLNGSGGQWIIGRGDNDVITLNVTEGSVLTDNTSLTSVYGYESGTFTGLITGVGSKINHKNAGDGVMLGRGGGGNSSMTVADNGWLTVAGDLAIAYGFGGACTASLRVETHGTVVCDDLDIGGDVNGDYYPWGAGTAGTATLSIDVDGKVNTSGRIAVKAGSTTTIEFDFDDSAGAQANGQITAAGDVDISGASLVFDNQGLDPSGGEIDFIFANAITATDITDNLATEMGGVSYTFGVVDLAVGGGQALRLTYDHAPEPATLGLICAGGVMVLLRRRRK